MLDAEAYDSHFVPTIFEPWSRELIKRAQVWKGDRVLDVACGTGIVACRIAGMGSAVTGLDRSAEYLERAKLRASEESVSVKWIEGSAEALPFRQPAFDLVTCQHGLQFFGDRALAAREMKRVIAPGGRVVISTWAELDKQGPSPLLHAIAARHGGTPSLEPYALADAGSLNKLLLDAKFFAINIETVTRQVRVPDPDRHVRTVLADLLAGPVSDEIVTEGLAAIAPFVESDQVSFPTTALIAVGRVKT